MVDELRARIRGDVAGRVPVDQREADSVRAFLDAFDGLASPFDEHADPVHVTASALLVAADGSAVVLHKHKRLGVWLQPGGHIDPGELPWNAARREAEEETGLVCTLGSERLAHVDVHPGPRGHTHLDVRYVVTAALDRPNPPQGESQEVRWFGWDEALELADVGLAGALRELRGRVEQPGGGR